MYNPENLDLPSYNDPRLTEYSLEYLVGAYTHVFALNSSEADDIPLVDCTVGARTRRDAESEISLAEFDSGNPAAFLAWFPPALLYKYDPEEDNVSFDLTELDPGHPDFSCTSEEIARLLKLENVGDLAGMISWWIPEAESEDCDTIVFQTHRAFHLEWDIKGWDGLTLDYLKANVTAPEFRFTFDMSEDVSYPEAIYLEEFKHPDVPTGFDLLTYKDVEHGAKFLLNAYRANPSESLAREAAAHLHKLGGPEFVKFHLPELRS